MYCVFPSTTEVSPKVCPGGEGQGLCPSFVAADHGGGQFVARSGEDGIVLTAPDAASWARAIEPLVVEETRRSEIGRQARQWIEREWPDWGEVLERDWLAAWHEAALNGRYLLCRSCAPLGKQLTSNVCCRSGDPVAATSRSPSVLQRDSATSAIRPGQGFVTEKNWWTRAHNVPDIVNRGSVIASRRNLGDRSFE